MIFRKQLKPEPAKNPSLFLNDETSRVKTQDILARTIWGEARGETLNGKEAVANVILNRFKLAQRRGSFWWGNTIEEICQKPMQFSCWNHNDPNYPKLIAVTEADQQFAICQRIARRALSGVLPDHTFDADHYHEASIHPNWSEGRVPTATIGHHVFYQLEKQEK
jgi:spore germination cell wall hydrolase CwlJ-like protein